MITKQDLEEKRTPAGLSKFVESTFDSIRSVEEKKHAARRRKQPYKELIEEIYPLSIFCKLKYKDTNVLCAPVIGSQGFDAIIESECGDLIENIELTWPIDGQKAHTSSEQLNKYGITDVEVWGVDDSRPRDEIIERIINAAKKKSIKDYSTESGSSIVFIVDVAPYFGMQEIEHKDDIDTLVRRLGEIEYKANNAYLLFLPIQKLIQIK